MAFILCGVIFQSSHKPLGSTFRFFSPFHRLLKANSPHSLKKTPSDFLYHLFSVSQLKVTTICVATLIS